MINLCLVKSTPFVYDCEQNCRYWRHENLQYFRTTRKVKVRPGNSWKRHYWSLIERKKIKGDLYLMMLEETIIISFAEGSATFPIRLCSDSLLTFRLTNDNNMISEKHGFNFVRCQYLLTNSLKKDSETYFITV